MAELLDPNMLPTEQRPSVPASQIIAWLLYPVIFVVGLSVGLVIGLKQVKTTSNANVNQNTNLGFTNASIITGNRNTVVINGPTNGNTNATTNLNTNTVFRSGDYLKLEPATQTRLDTEKQAALDTLVDKSADITDILRQQDLIDLKYTLLAYFEVRGSYPDTGGQLVKLDKSEADIFYTNMKDYFGGTFYEKIDPKSPDYYYGYTSNGTSFTLTAYLVSLKKPFQLTN